MNGESVLDMLAKSGTIMQLSCETFVAALDDHMRKAYEKGFFDGAKSRASQLLEAMIPPMTIKAAAKSCGMCESTFRRHMALGDVRVMDTNGDAKVLVSEVERFKETLLMRKLFKEEQSKKKAKSQ